MKKLLLLGFVLTLNAGNINEPFKEEEDPRNNRYAVHVVDKYIMHKYKKLRNNYENLYVWLEDKYANKPYDKYVKFVRKNMMFIKFVQAIDRVLKKNIGIESFEKIPHKGSLIHFLVRESRVREVTKRLKIVPYVGNVLVGVSEIEAYTEELRACKPDSPTMLLEEDLEVFLLRHGDFNHVACIIRPLASSNSGRDSDDEA